MQINQILKSSSFFRMSLLIVTLINSAIAFAQDKKVDVNITTDKGGGFFASPWVWIVGAAIFILLLVALLRGGSKNA